MPVLQSLRWSYLFSNKSSSNDKTQVDAISAHKRLQTMTIHLKWIPSAHTFPPLQTPHNKNSTCYLIFVAFSKRNNIHNNFRIHVERTVSFVVHTVWGSITTITSYFRQPHQSKQHKTKIFLLGSTSPTIINYLFQNLHTYKYEILQLRMHRWI